MTPLSRILCAVDASAASEAAFMRALALSAAHDAELTVVTAVPPDQPFGLRAGPRRTTFARLRQAAEAQGVRLRTSVQHGDPASVIRLLADTGPFDLVVVGTHQRVGLARLRAGSVAERIVQGVRCPVLVVPAVAASSSDVEPVASFRRVVCALDLRAVSTAVLQAALPMARASGGRLTLLHVVRGPSPELASRYGGQFNVPEFHRLLADDAWRRLQDVIPRDRLPAVPAVHARVVSGTPSDEIVRVADAGDADLIVMGVTGRGPIARQLVGSTTTRVIRRSPCAVLAVPDERPGRLPLNSTVSATLRVAA